MESQSDVKSQKKFIAGLMQELKDHAIEDSDIQTAVLQHATPHEQQHFITTKSFHKIKMNKTGYHGQSPN